MLWTLTNGRHDLEHPSAKWGRHAGMHFVLILPAHGASSDSTAS